MMQSPGGGAPADNLSTLPRPHRPSAPGAPSGAAEEATAAGPAVQGRSASTTSTAPGARARWAGARERLTALRHLGHPGWLRRLTARVSRGARSALGTALRTLRALGAVRDPQAGHRSAVTLGVASVTVVACLAAGLRACPPLEGWVDVTRGSAPATNPLKGMIPYAPDDPGREPDLVGSALPYTMEWVYLPLSEVVTGPETYDWSPLESYLEAVATRGHHTVLRFYMDYPGRDSAIPRYLVEGGLVATRPYPFHQNGSVGHASVSPDYNDPDMMTMLTSFITAFGQRYDGDPRLGFITQGLVGFWGEGHTWPMDGSVSTANPRGEDWMASEDNQRILVSTWDDAFDTTPTQVRYPTTWSAAQAVGYHDDSFGYATLDDASWHFMALMRAAGATEIWRTQPIGGEVYPDIQDCALSDPQHCGPAQGSAQGDGSIDGGSVDLDASIRATHATWLLNEWAFTGSIGDQEHLAALEASSATGYELAAQRWRVCGTTLEVQLTNHGVAPFYYDWDVEAVALSSSGAEVDRVTLAGSLRDVLPGQEVTFSGELDVPEEGATVLLRAVNPLEGGVPLRFANTGQDTTWVGYLTLGGLGTTGSPEEAGGSPG